MMRYTIDPTVFRKKLDQAGELMKAGNIQQSRAVFEDLFAALRMNGYKQRRAQKVFRKVFFGLGPDEVLAALYDKAIFHMNASEANRALLYFRYYRQIEKDFGITFQIDYEMAMSEAESQYRVGNTDEAISLYSRLLKNEKDSSRKVDILIRKGTLESRKNQNKFAIVNSLSKALGDAEASQDNNLIAMCYFELAAMLGVHYPALGVSLLWRARIWYEHTDEKEMLAFLKSRLALAYYLLWCANSDERFLVGAKELINDGIDRDVFSHEAGKASFDRDKGIINSDLSLLDSALSYFEKSQACGEVCKTAEAYIKTANILKDIEAAKDAAARYEKGALMLNDADRLNYIRSIDISLLSWYPPKENNDMPTLLDVLERIAFEEEKFQLDNVKNPLFPTHYQEGMFKTIEKSDGKVYLYPCELFPLRYYRGQSDKLEGKKCQPSLFRGLSESKKFRERLCLMELDNLIHVHPLTGIFEGGLSYSTPEGPHSLSLSVDTTALGQHYGIKTEDLDLTADKWVAAFFAATDYVDGEYRVHTAEGEGVLYIFQHIPLDESTDRLGAVGLQPFSRPGCQAGVVYRMEPQEDFNDRARRIVFKHDPAVNELIFNFCNRSKKLFPQEILEGKVIAIKESKVYSYLALSMAISRYYKDTPPELIESYIAQEGISFQSMYPVPFTKDELEEFIKKWPQEKAHFFDPIYLKLAYRGPIDTEDDI